MEVAKEVKTSDGRKEEEEGVLPGFRFHPTDEELVGYYLRRKVEKKPISIQFIKQIDIYKYDPWDLPKSSVGEREKYFFCRRERKYKNSVRPNRATESGFWKATGIDRPIVCTRDVHGWIGLKKSLVYYVGNAGKGSKTGWMMHEFRLPPNPKISNLISSPHAIDQEAEVWTLCRIFKRISTHKKYASSLKQTSSLQLQSNPNPDDLASSKSNSLDSENPKSHEQVRERKSMVEEQFISLAQTHGSSASSASNLQSLWNSSGEDFFESGSWDELRAVVHLAFEPSPSHDYGSLHI